MSALDHHGQPIITKFNTLRNRDRALFSLLGICEGLVADQTLNQRELLFLDTWMRNQQHLKGDADVVDIIDCVTDILRDGVITRDELEDMLGLLSSIVNHRSIKGSPDDQINRLLAIVQGITADQYVSDREVAFLQNWLNDHAEIKEEYPGNIIARRITDILSDGIVTESERLDLLDMLNKVTGDRFEETGLAHGLATEFCVEEPSSIDHEGKIFCFTGQFVQGTRRAVENTAVERGAVIVGNITKSLNFLVIGTLASRDWRFSSHGRKIQKALEYKQQGCPVIIINERIWLQHL